jgi:adenylyltransferase/sulfurtransferase
MEITPDALMQELESEHPPVLLDVREAYEREISKLEGDVHIPMHELPARVNELEAGSEIVVYCRSGVRSGHVVQFLCGHGYRARNLVGGINAWAAVVDPSLPQD